MIKLSLMGNKKPDPGFAKKVKPPSKNINGRKGRHGGPKVDRFERRKRKAAEASRRRNRR